MADWFDVLGQGIGGGFGLVGGIISSRAQKEAARRQERLQKERAQRISKAAAEADTTYEDMMRMIEDARGKQYQLSDPSMAAEYKSAIQGYDPSKMVYDFDQFSFDKTKDDYVTPYMDDILGQVEARVQGTAAGAGLGRGTGTAQAIASADAEKMNELYQQAQQQYQADRDFAYKSYSDYITNMQNKYNTLANLTSNKINLMGGAIQHDETQTSDYLADILGVMGDKAQTKLTSMIQS